MASINPYPSGSDIIAPLPLYTPDFGMMNSMLQRRSAMFEQGLSQVKSSDSLIRNAALSVSDNQVVRDSYIKQAETQLQKLQGADFSQMQNVESAQQVYAPFWQDQDLLMDYSKTSAINAERTRAESMAQSSDPKVREQYWQDGANYVALSANELSMAKRGDGSISKVKVNKYVPFFDTMSELKKRAKDQGYVIEKETPGGPNNAYKITRTNGPGSVPIYKEWAATELASMPQAEAMFQIKGVVEYRSQVQQYQAQGYDESTAKKMTADAYMNRQKEYFVDRKSNLDEQVMEMTKKLDAMDIGNRANQDAGKLKPEKLAERNTLADLITSYKNRNDTFQEGIDKYSKTDSKEYQDDYNSLVNGGEDFLRKFNKDALIQNFANNMASNSKEKYELDPAYKANLELQKTVAQIQQDDYQFGVRYGDGTNGTVKGSGTSSGNKKDEVNPLDTPLYMGRSITGNDPFGAQKRLNGYYQEEAVKFNNTTNSIINEAGMLEPSKLIAPSYLEYLKNTITTGKFTANKELEAEHKRLQDLKIIPKNYKLGESPMQLQSMLYSRAVSILKEGANSGIVNANIFTRVQQRDRQAKSYLQVREINNEVQKQILAEPTFKPLMKDGKLMEKADFMKQNLGYGNKDSYIKAVGVGTMDQIDRIANANTYGAVARNRFNTANDRWDTMEETYNKAYGLVKDKTATMMQKYINMESALIGQEIKYSTDRQGDTEISQNIASQAISPFNMANQIVEKDGSGYPQNIKQLEDMGADKEIVKNIISLTQNNIDSVMDNVILTKVGTNGNPSVKIFYNMDQLKQSLGEKKFNSEEVQKTILALGSKGIELDVSKAKIDAFDQEIDLMNVSTLGFDKNNIYTASPSVKEFGFDYTILKDPAQQQYILNFKYMLPTGQQQTTTSYFPLATPINKILSKLDNTMYNIYTGNQQVLQKPGGSGNFISRDQSYDSLIQK